MVLASALLREKREEKCIRCLVLGLDNAGKSSIVARFLGDDPRDVAPTMGFDIRSKRVGEIVLDFWDVGGQRSLRDFWSNYFHAANALVWVVDSTDADRLDTCREELHSILRDERLNTLSILVLANKRDLSGALTPAFVGQTLGVRRPASESGQETRELVDGCSAIQDSTQEIQILFLGLLNECRARLFPETAEINLHELTGGWGPLATLPPAWLEVCWRKIPTSYESWNLHAVTRENLFGAPIVGESLEETLDTWLSEDVL